MIKALQNISLSQQLALTAATCSLLVALALVALGSVSSRHMQQAQQQAFGNALAAQVAKRVGSSLETGDLLSVAASLQRFVDTSAAEQVELFDVEGKALGRTYRFFVLAEDHVPIDRVRVIPLREANPLR